MSRRACLWAPCVCVLECGCVQGLLALCLPRLHSLLPERADTCSLSTGPLPPPGKDREGHGDRGSHGGRDGDTEGHTEPSRLQRWRPAVTGSASEPRAHRRHTEMPASGREGSPRAPSPELLKPHRRGCASRSPLCSFQPQLCLPHRANTQFSWPWGWNPASASQLAVCVCTHVCMCVCTASVWPSGLVPSLHTALTHHNPSTCIVCIFKDLDGVHLYTHATGSATLIQTRKRALGLLPQSYLHRGPGVWRDTPVGRSAVHRSATLRPLGSQQKTQHHTCQCYQTVHSKAGPLSPPLLCQGPGTVLGDL
nr:uncharacterized protein LOC127493489 [Oryctolagus cuniculus]